MLVAEPVDKTTDIGVANTSICLDHPSNQAAVETLSGWVCALPPQAGASAGGIELYNDTRVTWAIGQLGGVLGDDILELGPLEASHSYMLEQAGAAHITAIEANRLCYLKCLVIKEVLKLHKCDFLLGNFLTWLQASDRRFDTIWAAGVLYHMTDPVELLHLIGERTNKVHIWTHYVPDDDAAVSGEWAASFVRVDHREVRGRTVAHHLKAYGDVVKNKTYCGGVFDHTVWLRRADILEELRRAGFNEISVAHEVTEHLHGPSFAIAALRTGASKVIV